MKKISLNQKGLNRLDLNSFLDLRKFFNTLKEENDAGRKCPESRGY